MPAKVVLSSKKVGVHGWIVDTLCVFIVQASTAHHYSGVKNWPSFHFDVDPSLLNISRFNKKSDPTCVVLAT